MPVSSFLRAPTSSRSRSSAAAPGTGVAFDATLEIVDAKTGMTAYRQDPDNLKFPDTPEI